MERSEFDIKISPELWQPIDEGDREKKQIEKSNTSTTYRQNVWIRFKKNKIALIGLMSIVIFVLLAVIGPFASDYSYSQQELSNSNQQPSAEHWFGTDYHGRDIFVRVLYGARISLFIGISATIINLFIGVLYGSVAGYFGGRIDNFMMRLVDIFSAIPLILYAVLLMVVIGSGLNTIIVAIGSVYWVRMARIVRGEICSLRAQEYVLAAKVLGANTFRILVKHLIPNVIGSIIVTMTFMIPEAIFTESFLSFIGIGVSPPMASWGSLVADALGGFRSYPYQLFFPSLAICLTIISFNFLGEGLRDAFDPYYGSRRENRYDK